MCTNTSGGELGQVSTTDESAYLFPPPPRERNAKPLSHRHSFHQGDRPAYWTSGATGQRQNVRKALQVCYKHEYRKMNGGNTNCGATLYEFANETDTPTTTQLYVTRSKSHDKFGAASVDPPRGRPPPPPPNGHLRNGDLTHRYAESVASVPAYTSSRTELIKDTSKVDSVSQHFRRRDDVRRSSHSLLPTTHHQPTTPAVPGRVTITVASSGVLGLLSLLTLALAVQLLFRLSDNWFERHERFAKLATPVYEVMQQVAVALTSLVLILNALALLVTIMQFAFAARFLAVHRGYERAQSFLSRCSGVRFMAMTGFFLSLPIFLVGVLLNTLLDFKAITAAIAVGVISVGVILSLLAFASIAYVWSDERRMAGVVDARRALRNGQSEMSTLV